MATTAYLTHPDCLLHRNPGEHPEHPDRLRAIEAGLKASGLWERLSHSDVPFATREQLTRAHQADYVDLVEAAVPENGFNHLSFDAGLCAHTWDAARRAAGAVVRAVDMLMFEEADNAFCAVRPPGHHAVRDLGMGFCIFNNVAVGAAHALAEYGLERVAIIDFDVHHGNGTEAIFRRDNRVMLCSTFEHPFYPFSGTETTSLNMINIPMPAGTGSSEFRAAMEGTCLPWLDDFRPQMLFISAGFDAHAADPLANFELQEDDYAWVTRRLMDLAATHAQGRLVSVLEGGYCPDTLARCVVTHVSALLDVA